MNPAIQRMSRARTALLLDEPFYGQLALRLALCEDSSCKNAWTDARVLGFNPAYVETLADVELKGLVAHLVMHIAAGHPWRMEGRVEKTWNDACDYAINPVLKRAGFRLPQGSLERPEFDGKSAEAVYAVLAAGPETPKDPASKGMPDDESPPKYAGDPDADPSSESTDVSSSEEVPLDSAPGEVRAPSGGEEQEAEWRMAVSAASKMQGDLSAGTRRMVDQFLAARTDWREVLRDLIERALTSETYSWAKPRGRYLHMGLYLPSLEGERVPPLVVVRDTSASISNRDLCGFNAEFLDIAETVKPEQLCLIDADAAVKRTLFFEPEDFGGDFPETMPDDALGGGGTSFIPALEWVGAHMESCGCLVYLTDLLGSFPATAPAFPVLWVVPEELDNGVVPPFGDKIILRTL